MMDLVDYFTQGKVFSKNRYNADIFNFYKAEIDDFNRLWDREAKISEARAAARSKRQVYYVSRDKQLLNDYRLQAFKNAASLNILFNNGLNLAEYQAKANYQFKRLLSVWPGKIGSKYYCRKIFTADMEINLNFDRFLKQLDNFNSSHDPEYFKSPVSLEGYLRSVSYCHRGLIAK
jgi:hypothetical protein